MRLHYTANGVKLPENTLILIRHGVDDMTLTEELNQPLIEETKPDIMNLGREIADYFVSNRLQSARLAYSNRLRAQETAEILSKQLRNAGILLSAAETEGVREVFQGKFIIKDHIEGNGYKPLLDAWVAWQEKLDACELLYRFGDPAIKSDREAEFPSLIGWFKEYGEHQGEFSLRLYRLLREVFDIEGHVTDIIVGHQASCSRIQRVISAAGSLKSADEFKPGEFVRYLEKGGSRSTIHPACGIVMAKPEKRIILDVLSKEIEYLQSIT